MKVHLLALGVLFGLATLAAADESGPKAGEKVPELKAFGVIGSVEGKEADFAKERKELPTVYVFVQAKESGIPLGERRAARFLKELDKGVGDAAKDAAVVAVWLGDKAFDKHKEYLPRIQMSLKFEKTSLAAFDGNTSGPNNWAVNSDTHLTVVVAQKGKVVKSFALTSVDDKDVQAVLNELKKAAK